ncbi:hypothetical protein ACHAXT_012084 [Thalassiosira profunda]
MPSPVHQSADMNVAAGSSQSSAGSEQSSDLLSPPNAAAATAGTAGAGPAAAEAGPPADHICRKSYADTQTVARPSFNTTAAEWDSARKPSAHGNAAGAPGGNALDGDANAMDLQEGDVNDAAAGGGGLAARRWLHRDQAKSSKSYAHGGAGAIAAAASGGARAPEAEANMDHAPSSSAKKKRQHPLAAKFAKFEKRRLERESLESNSPEGSDDLAPSAKDSSALDPDAPAKFRESYETKNSSHQKNLDCIEQIARNQEEAMHLNSFVAIPRDNFFEVDEESLNQEPLTCPQGESQFWNVNTAEDEEDDPGDEGVDFGGGGGDMLGQELEDEQDEVREAIEDIETDPEPKPASEEPEAGDSAAEKPPAKEPSVGEDEQGLEKGTTEEPEPEAEEKADGTMALSKSKVPAYAGDTDEGEYKTDDQESDDDDDESELPSPFHGKKPAAKPAASGKPPLQPNNAGKKARRGKGALALALDEEHGGPEKMDVDAHANKGRAAEPKKKVPRRKGNVALALATEDDQTQKEAYDGEAEAEEETKGKRRKKHDPTAMALAEYEETGEVDSYFSREAAQRKAVLSKKHSETQGQGFFNDDDEEEAPEDYGHTSFHGDDNREMVGTEKQSEPLLGTEMQTEPASGTEKQSEPLTGTEKQSSEPPNGTEKQSEPLLSSSGAEQSATNGTSTTENITRDTDEMVVALRDELRQMGKAVTCAICQGSLTKTKVLPCGHQYCSGCLKVYHNPKPVKDPENKKRTLSPPKCKDECPECRAPAARRAGVAIPQTDEIVGAYKKIEREFGWAPRRYQAQGIVMTQIAPGEGGSFDDFDSDEEDAMATKEDRAKREQEYQEHLQVSSTNHGALERKKEAAQRRQTMSLKEQIEKQNDVRRWGQMVQEQSAVVDADEEAVEALLRAHKRFGGAKEMVAAHTANFLGKSDATHKPESEISASGSTIPIGEKKPSGSGAANNDKMELEELPEEEEQFCTAPDDLQSLDYSTAREESQATSSVLNTTAMSHTVIHDGNTAKKADRPDMAMAPSASVRGSSVLEWERSPESLRVAQRELASASAATAAGTRESVDTATGRNSPLVLHDGNTVRKQPAQTKSNADMDFDLDVDPTPRRSGRISPLPSKTLPLERAMEVDAAVGRDGGEGPGPMPAPRVAAAAASSAPIAKGTIVVVQARTWPGINKPGGVARVTKVHPAAAEVGQSTKYDVAYVLGGKEKKVDESFVSIHEPDPLPTIEERPDSARTTRGTLSAEKKSRPVRPRKAAVKAEPSATTASSVPIFNDEELQHIPDDVLKWAGIKPKEKKGKAKADGGKKEAPRSKKRVLADANGNAKSSKQTKKRKPSTKQEAAAMDEEEAPSPAVEPLDEIIGELSNEEIVTLADARYASLLSLDEKPSKANPLTLHVVTSSLSDKDSKTLDSLCKLLKGNNVALKVMKDFNPTKTQLCITASAASPKSDNEPLDVVSQSRTLKVMRSSLAGIPVLTPQWMESCVREGRLVAPSGAMCIRTLPRKQAPSASAQGDDEPTEHFGVAKYAAAYQKESLSSSNLLTGVSVMLCGSSAGSGMVKDLKVLLQQSGASIISSASMASRHLKDMSKGEAGRVVFLCDDSVTDKGCGISDALFKQAKKLLCQSVEGERLRHRLYEVCYASIRRTTQCKYWRGSFVAKK